MAIAIDVLGIMGLSLLWARRGRWRGWTLMAAWWWSMAAWATIAGVHSWWGHSGFSTSAAWSAWRYIAVVGACCPLMAVLGAKRPQDKPWQFIVLSLWVVLSLPAAQSFIHADRPLALHLAIRLFLLALAGAGVLNGLGTRYFPVAVAAAIGQLLLLAPHLGVFESLAPQCALTGIACLVFSFMGAILLDRRPSRAADSLSAVWLEFRDAYGGFWAARVLDRMNAAGRTQQWPVELGWNGFRALAGGDAGEDGAAASGDPPRYSPQLVQSLSNLLRRFASAEWIAAHLGPDLE